MRGRTAEQSRKIIPGLFVAGLVAAAHAAPSIPAGKTTPGSTSYPEGGLVELARVNPFDITSPGVQDFAVSPDGNTGYATCRQAFVRVRLASMEATGVWTVPAGVEAIRQAFFDMDQQVAWVQTLADQYPLERIDLPTMMVTGELQITDSLATVSRLVPYPESDSLVLVLSDGHVRRVDRQTLEVEAEVLLPPGQGYPTAAAIDHSRRALLVGTSENPATVWRLDVASLAISGSLRLLQQDGSPGSLLVDEDEGAFYMTSGLITDFRVVKGATDAMGRIGMYAPGTVYDGGQRLALDRAHRLGFVTTATAVKSFGMDSLQEVAANASTPAPNLRSLVFDPAQERLYAGTTTTSAIAELDQASLQPRRVGGLPTGDFGTFTTACLVSHGQELMAGTDTTPGRLFFLDSQTLYPGRTIPLATGENAVRCAVADEQHNTAYLGVSPGSNPTRIVKVSLDPAQRLGVLTIPSTFGATAAAIDPAGRWAWFGIATTPVQVIRVDLETFTIGAQGSPTEGAETVTSIIPDPARNRLLVAVSPTPRVVAMSMDTLVAGASIRTLPGDDRLYCGAADVASGIAYYGTSGATAALPSRLLQLNMATLEFAGVADFGTGVGVPSSLALDHERGLAFAGMDSRRIFVVCLADLSIQGIKIPPAESGGIAALALEPATGDLYAGLTRRAMRLTAVRHELLNASRFAMPETGFVDEVRFYTHAAEGLLRLSIYNDASPHDLLWASEAISPPSAGAEVSIPVGSGHPNALQLAAGNYFAAWQQETTATLGSWAVGPSGSGLISRVSFDEAPAQLDPVRTQTNGDLWTEYILYHRPTGASGWVTVGGEN